MRRQRVRRKMVVVFFLLLPVVMNYFSPYMMISGTAERIVTASLIVWALYFLTAMLLGRAACGYFCPFQGLQLIWEKVADRPLKRVRYLRATKYALWAAWVGGVVAVAVAVGGWTRVDLLYKTPTGISLDSVGNLFMYYTLVGITLAPMALGRRGFCHYFCPFSGYMIAGSKLGRALKVPALHLEANPSKCEECRSCERACPMSLPVTDMVKRNSLDETECLLCGSCVDGCKRGVLRYAFGRSRTVAGSRGSRGGPGGKTAAA